MPNHSVPCSPKQYFDLSSNYLCTIQPSLRHLDVTQMRSFSPFPRKNLHSTMLASIYNNPHTPVLPNHSASRAPSHRFPHSVDPLRTFRPSLHHLDVTTKRSFLPFPRKNLHSTVLASIYKNLHTPATPNHSARRALNRKLGHPLAFVAPSKSLVSPSKRHVLLLLLVALLLVHFVLLARLRV